jgi:hypothetical protein
MEHVEERLARWGIEASMRMQAERVPLACAGVWHSTRPLRIILTL